MPDCPVCRTPMNTARQREGIFYSCPSCDGRAMTVPQIRRMTGDAYATSLLRQINRASQAGDRPCPFCTAPMKIVRFTDPPLELDACRPCGVVWFDPHEFEVLPGGAVESPHEATMRGAEALANYKLERARREFEGIGEPEEGWKTIPAMLGFPVETYADPLERRPWLNWSLSAVIALVSICAFFDKRDIIMQFGLIPADAFRLAGFTWLSSFFLHGGIWHLVGNLYFLLIFGGRVEDYLGRWRYALLILLADLTGNLVHVLASSHSTVPCVGASGGISGVIVFYALQFPRARLSFLFGGYSFNARSWPGYWLAIPAWVALVLWLLMQSFTVMMQLSGFSNVAATAHFGGAAAGFALWLWCRKKQQTPQNAPRD